MMKLINENWLFDITKISVKYFVISLFTIHLFSCGGEEEITFSDEEIKAFESELIQRPIVIERNGIKLTEVTDIPVFKNASLKLLSNKIKFQPGTNLIEFDVDGFNLGETTVESKNYQVGKSINSQSILIVGDNNINTQVFEAKANLNLKLGSNKKVAFLNRSYNICLKQPQASCFFEINIDENGSSLQTNVQDSLLYVTLPRGEYSGNDINNVIFDFYLANISIGNKGNYLSLFIDEVEFKIYKYAAYRIQGLKYGKHIISAKLKNENGEIIKNVISDDNTYTIELSEISVFE